MKRIHWITLLMASASSFAANEVVLYGRVLGGVQNVNAAARAERAFFPADAGAVNGSTEVNDLYSRWGIKGEEALPEGLKAFFQIESGIGIDAADASFYVGKNSFASREGWVGLQGDFGAIKLGRGKTPYTQAAEFYDNFIGTHTFGSANFGTGYYALGSNYRSNNMLWYSTPKFGSIQGDAAYFTGENKSANGLDSRGWAFRMVGTWDSFDTHIAYQQAKDYEGIKGAELDQFVAGGSYYLGRLNFGAQHSQNKLRTGGAERKVKASSLFGAYAFDDIGTALRVGYVRQTSGDTKANVFNVGGSTTCPSGPMPWPSTTRSG
ncbi:porin [Chitinimonas arctica]|uniref:Porin n=1 Tax=Chitinimonas arctica TaxID=2594795 RepID=A0A516SFW9_9NEIS|nr:porin [Chitinimonas arctica]QDQ27042.1 porin [Chitinimonas arctica]